MASIVFQQLGGRDPQNIGNLEKSFKGNPSYGPGTLDLCQEIDALTDSLRKSLLCVTGFLSEVGYFEAHGDVSLRVLGNHTATLPAIMLPRLQMDSNYPIQKLY